MRSDRSLPLELVHVVCLHLEDWSARKTLAAVAQCSHAVYDVVIPILYRTLVITRNNADALFHGLPRDVRTFNTPTYAEYQAELERFKATHGGKINDFVDNGEHIILLDPDEWELPDSHTSGVWDDWPHVEDDPAYDELASVQRSNLGSWQRRLTLLSHCKHLIVMQVPRIGVVYDLWRGLSPMLDEDGRPIPSTTPDKLLFPNVTDMRISPWAIQHMSDWEHAHRSWPAPRAGDEGRMWFAGDPDHQLQFDYLVPLESSFRRLMAYAFGNSVENLCIADVPSAWEDPTTYLFRMLRGGPSSTLGLVELGSAICWFLGIEGHYLTSEHTDRIGIVARPLLRQSTLTLHGLTQLHMFAINFTGHVTCRCFFSEKTAIEDDATIRAQDVLLALRRRTEATLEVIDIGYGTFIRPEDLDDPTDDMDAHGSYGISITDDLSDVEKRIRCIVADTVALYPAEYDFVKAQAACVSIEKDPELEARLAVVQQQMASRWGKEDVVGRDLVDVLEEIVQADERRTFWESYVRIEEPFLSELSPEERPEFQRMSTAFWDLVEQTEMARKWNLSKRLLENPPPMPLKFLTERDAAPCVVCGAKHTHDMPFTEALNAAWVPRSRR